jgi:phage terminase small subunit
MSTPVARLRADGFDDDQPGLYRLSAHRVQIANTAASHLRAFAAEFGSLPGRRERLGITPPDDDEHSPFTGG